MEKNFKYLSRDQRNILATEDAREDQPCKIEIIDEHTANNLLSDISLNLDLSFHFKGSSHSTKGFAKSPEKQSELARFLIQKLNLRNRGSLLDVGFGANIHISNTFIDEGIEAYAIDEQQHDHVNEESRWHAPRKILKNEKGVEILSGDIADISDKKSELKDKSFGLILFNGSWTTGGNNWTVFGEEVLGAKYHDISDKKETFAEFTNMEKDKILQSCKKQLSENGLIGIVSSRYAFHGAGYHYSQLAYEKLSFIDAYDRLQRLGARKIYLLGITQDGFDQMLKRSIEKYPKENYNFRLKQDAIDLTRKQLRSLSNLPKEDAHSGDYGYPNYQKSNTRGAIEATKDIPELNAIARIDAIFAEF